MKMSASFHRQSVRLRTIIQCALAAFCLCAVPVSASVKDDATSLGGGWWASAWFGEIYDAGAGWIFSDKWGWIYEIDGGANMGWFYANDEGGWFWTDGATYPNVYRYSDAKWLSFWKETTDPRAYYDSASGAWLASDGSDGELWHDYYVAIVDAEVAEYSEIYRNLIAVDSHNSALPWNEDKTKLRVVSWMSGKYISSYVEGSEMTPSWETWVTVCGEGRSAAQASGLTGDVLTMRMKQYIGLPPDGNYEYWVEFYVSQSDLYRPSPDPDPRDCEAVLDFNAGEETTVGASYIEWFNNNADYSYNLSRNGYPWTRLGYTYDWRGGADEVGFSEFVIRPGSTITVVGVYTNAEYLEAE